MHKNKKGQAALEFLTTYGWAFLVILVMIGALAYFGVLNPERFVPETCTFGSAFACEDHVMTTSDATIKLRNNVEAITITEITVTDTETGTVVNSSSNSLNVTVDTTQNVSDTENASVSAGQVVDIIFDHSLGWTEGEKRKTSVDISYFKTSSGDQFTKTTGGDIVGTIQP